jgi:hypothetical protein
MVSAAQQLTLAAVAALVATPIKVAMAQIRMMMTPAAWRSAA